MHFQLMDCTRVLLEEIAHEEFSQKAVAITYSMALRSSYPTDWKTVNKAITDRWSFSGLERIKRMAFKGQGE